VGSLWEKFSLSGASVGLDGKLRGMGNNFLESNTIHAFDIEIEKNMIIVVERSGRPAQYSAHRIGDVGGVCL